MLPHQKDYVRDTKSSYLALCAGFGCVAGETKINGVRIDELQFALYVDTLLGKAKATRPFRKGLADLYQVTTNAGKSIIVTMEHRFLAIDGWQKLQDLVIGDLIAVEYPNSTFDEPLPSPQDIYIREVVKEHGFCPFANNGKDSYGWESITNIKFVRHDYFYDLHVPYHEHYVAEGFVNHNSGKSAASGAKSVYLSYLNSGYQGAVYSPSHGLAMDTMVPAIELALECFPVRWEFKVSPLPKFVVYWDEQNPSEILIRSFENWQKIRGLNLAWAIVDELDVVNPKISRPALKLLMGRIRTGNVRQIAFSSTPEGFGLMYEFFVTEARENRRIIKAKTTDNPHLPPDYLDNLLENYPANLVEAYVNGEFVNLARNTAYHGFDRVRNASNETIQPNDRLYIGQDFNIGKMASVVLVKRGDTYHAVDEIYGLLDTQTLAQELKIRYPNNKIDIFPDASGAARKTSASMSDLQILASNGFNIIVGSKNPAVKDRVNAVNAAFLNGKGVSRLFVNTRACPTLTRSLEQQALDDNGVPEKKNDLDHITESLGYVVYYQLPASGGSGFRDARVF